ncbi:inhibitor of growth protein 4-like [Corticium candelabrum]|uniref:inhibitor of growth protein 4-like n=1 Tax=Corticium candelabrum TaxID=121492 RepID=UPI002E254124|nr:inhibitor of growth protein 4-like [Corticium candelabrum]
MSASLYLEHYLESIEGLPFEMQRIFTLVRELDAKTQDILKEVDKECERYEEDVSSLQMAQRDSRLKAIDALYSKAKEYADEKVSLATQTYETIDKHIKRLDSDLARFQADLRDKESHSEPGSSELIVQRSSTENTSRKRSRHSKKDSDKKARRKRPKTSSVQFSVASATAPSPLEMTLDMPVDPNEPTYCLCQQVSYGEMVGCDNMDCPIEWFHFQCVGLTEKPKGKWYCPQCSQHRKKK